MVLMKSKFFTHEFNRQRARELKDLSDNIRFRDIFFNAISNHHTLKALETIFAHMSDLHNQEAIWVNRKNDRFDKFQLLIKPDVIQRF